MKSIKNILLSIGLFLVMLVTLVGCGKKKLDLFDSKIFNVENNGVVINYSLKDGYILPSIKNDIQSKDVRSSLKYNLKTNDALLHGDEIVIYVDVPDDLNEKYEVLNTSTTVKIPILPGSYVKKSFINESDIDKVKEVVINTFSDVKNNTATYYVDSLNIGNVKTIKEYSGHLINLFNMDEYYDRSKKISNPLFEVDENNDLWKNVGESTEIIEVSEYQGIEYFVKSWKCELLLKDILNFNDIHFMENNDKDSCESIDVFAPILLDSSFYDIYTNYINSFDYGKPFHRINLYDINYEINNLNDDYKLMKNGDMIRLGTLSIKYDDKDGNLRIVFDKEDIFSKEQYDDHLRYQTFELYRSVGETTNMSREYEKMSRIFVFDN